MWSLFGLVEKKDAGAVSRFAGIRSIWLDKARTLWQGGGEKKINLGSSALVLLPRVVQAVDAVD